MRDELERHLGLDKSGWERTVAAMLWLVGLVISILAFIGVYYLGPPDLLMPMVPALSFLFVHTSVHLFTDATREEAAEIEG